MPIDYNAEKASEELIASAKKASEELIASAKKASEELLSSPDVNPKDEATKLIKQAVDRAAELIKEATDRASALLSKALKENELIRLVLDSINQGIYVTDTQDSVILYNTTALEMFGTILLHESAVDRVKRIGFYLPDQKTLWPAYELPSMRVIRTGQAVGELVFIKNSQRPEGMWIMNYAYPLKKLNDIIGTVVVFKEIIQSAEGLPQLGVNIPPIPL